MFKFNEKGMMLLCVLLFMVLIVMLTTSMIVLKSETLNITGNMDKKTRALQAAEAGLEYAFYQLNIDNTRGDPNAAPFFLKIQRNLQRVLLP